MTSPVASMSSSRWSRMWDALAREDKRSLAGMAGFIVVLHVVGFGVLALVVPRHFDLGSTGIFGIGVGILAYTLGMRHAFDADHIAAVDNTTRKLIADGDRCRSGSGSPSATRRSCSGWRSCCPSASRPWRGRARTTPRDCTRSPGSSAPRCPGSSCGSSGSSTSSSCSTSSVSSGACAPGTTATPNWRTTSTAAAS